MSTEEQFLRHPKDIYHNIHLKLSMKEDEDFVMVPNDVWEYLCDIYDGIDIPRYSI